MDFLELGLESIKFIINLIIFIGIFRVWKSRSVANRVISQTTFYAENKDYVSAETFFNTIEKHLSPRSITGLRFSRTTLKEKTAFEGSRTYLVLRKRDVIYYINTFSLGNTQIFSYWQIEPFAFWRRVWSFIPLLGRLILSLFFPKSLYKLDEAAGVKGVIQHDLKVTLDELLGPDGYHLSSTTTAKDIHKLFFA